MLAIPFLRILCCLVLVAFLPTADLQADDIRLFADWTYSYSSIESEDRRTEEVTKTESERYKQNYRLDITKELFPNLTLEGGAQVEDVRQFNDLDGDDSDTRGTSVRPYIDAELRTALYSLSAGYEERNDKSRGSDIDTKRDYVDTYNLRGEWRPVELPRFDVSYVNTERHDKPRTQRTENSILQLNSRYDYRNYEFQYSYLHSEDQIDNTGQNSTGSEINTHNGRVRYSQDYLDGSVTLNASLRAEYSDQTFSGEGPRDFAVFPAGTSFYTPDGNLNPNNNDSTAYADFSSGVQLDLRGGDIINVGLDFGEKVEVDMLQLALVGELDSGSTISNAANWSVYVSTDQEIWLPRGGVSVEYLREEGRLKIRFSPQANHDYLLLIYNPPLDLNQSQPVFISSLRGFVTRVLTDGSELSSHAHDAQLGVGWQVTEKTRLLYDMSLQEREDSLSDEQRIGLNNGLTVLHRFNEVFSGSGRLSANDTWEDGKHDASIYAYSARLSARYLETLNQSLVYSGSRSLEPEGDTTANSVLLHTNAELYRGWDVAFNQGYSWLSPAEGDDSSSFFISIQNSLVPHQRLNLFADYSMTWDKETGSDWVRTDSGRLRGLWIPSDTLSLNGEVQIRVNDDATDIFWEYGVSWLPFRDGTLQCNLNYSEEEDIDGNRQRSFSPSITWEVTDYATLAVRYSLGTKETNSTIDDFQSLLVDLMVYYN